MMTRRQASAGLLSSGASAATQTVLAQEAAAMELPPPRTDGGKPLIQALRLRRSIREYADKPLAAQVLSDLLWAAFGINRPAMGDRTALSTVSRIKRPFSVQYQSWMEHPS